MGFLTLHGRKLYSQGRLGVLGGAIKWAFSHLIYNSIDEKAMVGEE